MILTKAYLNNVRMIVYYWVFAKWIKPLPPEPQLSDFYHPLKGQKNNKLLFAIVGIVPLLFTSTLNKWQRKQRWDAKCIARIRFCFRLKTRKCARYNVWPLSNETLSRWYRGSSIKYICLERGGVGHLKACWFVCGERRKFSCKRMPYFFSQVCYKIEIK